MSRFFDRKRYFILRKGLTDQEVLMKKARFTETQIVAILKEADCVCPLPEVAHEPYDEGRPVYGLLFWQ
jgi:hypothetical protein